MNLEDIKQFLSTEFPHLHYYEPEYIGKAKYHVFYSKLGGLHIRVKINN
jgi:hypothetical protein